MAGKEGKKLSIIVPVYNVEQYIRSCVEGIFRHGLEDSDFELILVNNGILDNSSTRLVVPSLSEAALCIYNVQVCSWFVFENTFYFKI